VWSQDTSFSLQDLLHSRIQLHPSITVLEFRTDEFGHPVFKNSGLRSATKAESVKRLSGKSFFANLDPTPACPPREALSSVILVGFQFRCVIQDGRKPDNQMPNVTRGRVSRSASPCPANSSWNMLFKVLLSSNLQFHFGDQRKWRSQVSLSMLDHSHYCAQRHCHLKN